MKRTLERIVSILTRLAMKLENVAESPAGYRAAVDYEHRFAEHEHEEEPEPADATEPPTRSQLAGSSTAAAG